MQCSKVCLETLLKVMEFIKSSFKENEEYEAFFNFENQYTLSLILEILDFIMIECDKNPMLAEFFFLYFVDNLKNLELIQEFTKFVFQKKNQNSSYRITAIKHYTTIISLFSTLRRDTLTESLRKKMEKDLEDPYIEKSYINASAITMFDFLINPHNGIILNYLLNEKIEKFDLKIIMLTFLAKIFKYPKLPFLFIDEYPHSYIRYHYLNFIQLYINQDHDENTIKMCTLHLEVLKSFASNKNPIVSKKFFQLRIVWFLAKEIELEFVHPEEKVQNKEESEKNEVSEDEDSIISSEDDEITEEKKAPKKMIPILNIVNKKGDTAIPEKNNDYFLSFEKEIEHIEKRRKSSINLQYIPKVESDDSDEGSLNSPVVKEANPKFKLNIGNKEKADKGNDSDSEDPIDSPTVVKKPMGMGLSLNLKKNEDSDTKTNPSLKLNLANKLNLKLNNENKDGIKSNLKKKLNDSFTGTDTDEDPIDSISEDVKKITPSFKLNLGNKINNSIKSNENKEKENFKFNLKLNNDKDGKSNIKSKLNDSFYGTDTDEDPIDSISEDVKKITPSFKLNLGNKTNIKSINEEKKPMIKINDNDSDSDTLLDSPPKIKKNPLLKLNLGINGKANGNIANKTKIEKDNDSDSEDPIDSPTEVKKPMGMGLSLNLKKNEENETNTKRKKLGLNLESIVKRDSVSMNSDDTQLYSSKSTYRTELNSDEDEISEKKNNSFVFKRSIDDEDDTKYDLEHREALTQRNIFINRNKTKKKSENKMELYSNERLSRKIYSSEELHSSLLELLIQLLLTSKQTLDKEYTDQHPLNKNMLNIPFMLHCHLNHSMNQNIIPLIHSRVLNLGRGAIILLRLCVKSLFKPDIYHIKTGKLFHNKKIVLELEVMELYIE
jgi:hypothetical protein